MVVTALTLGGIFANHGAVFSRVIDFVALLMAKPVTTTMSDWSRIYATDGNFSYLPGERGILCANVSWSVTRISMGQFESPYSVQYLLQIGAIRLQDTAFQEHEIRSFVLKTFQFSGAPIAAEMSSEGAMSDVAKSGSTLRIINRFDSRLRPYIWSNYKAIVIGAALLSLILIYYASGIAAIFRIIIWIRHNKCVRCGYELRDCRLCSECGLAK